MNFSIYQTFVILWFSYLFHLYLYRVLILNDCTNFFDLIHTYVKIASISSTLLKSNARHPLSTTWLWGTATCRS